MIFNQGSDEVFKQRSGEGQSAKTILPRVRNSQNISDGAGTVSYPSDLPHIEGLISGESMPIPSTRAERVVHRPDELSSGWMQVPGFSSNLALASPCLPTLHPAQASSVNLGSVPLNPEAGKRENRKKKATHCTSHYPGRADEVILTETRE
jgi:hypothetical protein